MIKKTHSVAFFVADTYRILLKYPIRIVSAKLISGGKYIETIQNRVLSKIKRLSQKIASCGVLNFQIEHEFVRSFGFNLKFTHNDLGFLMKEIVILKAKVSTIVLYVFFFYLLFYKKKASYLADYTEGVLLVLCKTAF